MKYIKSFYKINEGISDYQKGDSIVTNLQYSSWENLVNSDSGIEVNSSDVKLITSLVSQFANRLKRNISEPITCKDWWFNRDEFECCISYDVGNESADDYVTFYKFIDEWWGVEIKYENAWKYFLCDGIGGLQKLMFEESI